MVKINFKNTYIASQFFKVQCMKYLLSFLVTLISFSLFGQKKSVMMFNSRGIDTDRYEDIKGSPYLFDEWKYGRTIDSKANLIDSLQMNYNGYTHNIEVRKGDTYIELDAYHYPLVILYDDDGSEIFFKRNFSKTLFNRYPRIIYNGNEFAIVQDFTVRVETKRVNDVGKIRDTNTFVGRRNYYLVQDSRARLIKLRKRSILPLIGHKEELEDYMKQKKLKINSEETLITLLKFYDERGYTNY